MKLSVPLTVLIAGILVAGCASHKSAQPRPVAAVVPMPPVPSAQNALAASQPIVTPDTSPTARVVSYNSVARFVVLSFPGAQMPALNQTLFLYRNGLKVAELKVTGPQDDSNIVADLVNGTAEVGDEVRDQ